MMIQPPEEEKPRTTRNPKKISLKAILDELRMFHFERGYCPSVRQLEAKFDISRMTVWRMVKILERQGHLECIPCKGIVLL